MKPYKNHCSGVPFSRFFLFLAMVSCSLGLSTPGFSQSIQWYPDVPSATQAAAQQKKMVLLHFTADWCRPCKTLETFVFSNSAVERAFHANVIAVKVDAETEIGLVKKYGVASIPYDIALTPTGRVVSKRKSPLEVSAYVKMLDDFGPLITTLQQGEDPALAQSLSELEELMANQDPKFEGQPTSFTPDAPHHPAPTPSLNSSELKRKSQARVVNPYATPSAEASSKHVANAFHPVQTPTDFPSSGALPASHSNSTGFGAPTSEHSIPSQPQPQPSSFGNSLGGFAPTRPAAQIKSPAQQLGSPFQAVAASKPVAPQRTNGFNPTPLDANSDDTVSAKRTVTQNGFTPPQASDAESFGAQPSPPTPPSGVTLKPLEQPEVATPIAGAKAQQRLDGFQAKPKNVMNDKFFGQPSAAKNDKLIPVGNYQAKITLPNDTNDAIPGVQPFQPDAHAQIVIEEELKTAPSHQQVDSPIRRQGPLDALDTRERRAAIPPSNDQFANSSTIREGLSQASETLGKPEYALQGKCPVTLLNESKWVDGQPQWGCVHRNRIYIFASSEKLQQFQADPDAYSPILAGYDPVIFNEAGRLVDGLEKYGVFMGEAPHQRVVLFSTPETRARFQMDPRKYLDSVRLAMEASGGSSSSLVR